MITKQEVEDMKPATLTSVNLKTAAKSPWDCLVLIQCAKSPDVVTRTAELLVQVGRKEGSHLKGQ